MKSLQTDIVIIGAGLTGLTLAYYLKAGGMKVLLLEKSDRVGGVIQTTNENGFTFESGPNTGIINTAELVQLFQDLKLEFEIPGATSKARWIWKRGKWHALPTGILSAIFTPLFSVRDKIRVLGEPFRRRKHRLNESIAKLVRRRLGKSILRYAVDPFISGIYAGDPKKLIARYALPKLYALEQMYGSFVMGAVRRRKIVAAEKAAGITKSVFSIPGGLENLIHVLEEKIGKSCIMKGVSAVQINPQQEQYCCTFIIDNEMHEILTSKVISTIDGKSIAPLFPFINADVMSKITAIRYASVVQVVIGYKAWKGIQLDAFGGLIPSKEEKDILGILFPSTLFQHRAPEGGALLSVFMGGIKHPELFEKSDEELVEMVNENMKQLMQIGRASCREKVYI